MTVEEIACEYEERTVKVYEALDALKELMDSDDYREFIDAWKLEGCYRDFRYLVSDLINRYR